MFYLTEILSRLHWLSGKVNIIAFMNENNKFTLSCRLIFSILQKVNFEKGEE